MILVYPMLTSESVNQTLLPGLIKAIEKYILIYNTDEILKHFNTTISDITKSVATGAAVAAGGALIAVAADKLRSGGGDDGFPSAAHGTARIKQKGKALHLEQGSQSFKVRLGNTAQSAQSLKNPAIDAAEKGAKAGLKDMEKKGQNTGVITGFEMPKYDSVSLEPTWIQVHTSQGARIVGVKVVPFKVKSTKGMVGLLMNDTELKKMGYLANKASRTILRILFRILRGLKVPFISDKPVIGDPKTDIIWATSQYGKNTFVCFSKLDLEDDDVFASPRGVQKLHKLGWTSLIIADDVNKQATFCMKQFGGVCSTIPYSFIFSSLGKEHAQIYKDLEDAARSAGPFFRSKTTTRKKLFSDSITISKLEKYSALRG